MTKTETLKVIESTQIIAILRGDLNGREIPLCEVLVDAGILAIEVSLVSPGAMESIRVLANHFGVRAAIGAGTVLTPDEVDELAATGACFVVSPNSDPEVIASTLHHGMASFPGAYTATEIVNATRWGADAVKLFPAVTLTPQYISAMLGPLPDLRTVPTGGITADNLGAYLKAGAWAAGVGSELVRPSECKTLDTAALHQRASAFVAARARV